MKTKTIILTSILLVLFAIPSLAQNLKDSTIVQIETMDGNEFLGQIVREDSVTILLKTEKLGELSIKKLEIKSLKVIPVEKIKDGKLWFENPQSTRYFWAPNGYGLKKGEGYYQNIWVLWNQFSYGLTDHFSLGAGMIPLFLFGGGPTPVFITPKFSIPVVKNKFNIGVGAIAGYVLGEDGAGFGILYGTTTFGSPDKNFSIGIGEAFAGGDWAKVPVFNFSGMVRISSKGYFLSENYIGSIDGETFIMLSAGGRSIIRKVSLDYGLGIPIFPDMDTFVAFPWLGLEIPLGKSKNNHQ